MDRKFLGEIRRLINTAVADFAEGGGDDAPGKREAAFHKARVTISAELGEAFVDRRQIEKDIASTRSDLEALTNKEHQALRKGREDLARAVLIQRQTLESRLAHLAADHAAAETDIHLLERVSATLMANIASADGEPTLDARRIAAQLAELDGLLLGSKGG